MPIHGQCFLFLFQFDYNFFICQRYVWFLVGESPKQTHFRWTFVHNHEKAKQKIMQCTLRCFLNRSMNVVFVRRVQVHVRVRSFDKIFQVTLIIWSVFVVVILFVVVGWEGELRVRSGHSSLYAFVCFVFVLSICLLRTRRYFIGSDLTLLGLEIFYFCA